MSKFDSTVKFEKFKAKEKKDKPRDKTSYVEKRRNEKLKGRWD